jgi:hypothetical protein
MPTTSDYLEGGCACGAIRYRLTARPMFVHCGHCRDCQRQTGSAFVINALIEAVRKRWVKMVCPPGISRSKPQIPRAGRLTLADLRF